MNPAAKPSPAEQLRMFLAQHQTLIATALSAYADHMWAAAAQANERYAAIVDDPQARAAQDQSLITTQGLRIAGRMFADNAERAEAAQRDLLALDESLD